VFLSVFTSIDTAETERHTQEDRDRQTETQRDSCSRRLGAYQPATRRVSSEVQL